MSPSLRERMQRLVARRGPKPDASDAPVRRERLAPSAWRRFRRGTDRYRLMTDVIGGLVIVALVVGSLAAATGGVWPPLVVVESGSMMHAIQETPYGRIGTIDVGDIVFVRAIDGPEDIETWAQGGERHYGLPGDVIAYWPNGDRDTKNATAASTMIIHRAIAYLEVRGEAPDKEYILHWTDGEERVWGSAGIYFPPLGFDERSPYIFTPTNGYRPPYSGFITKGDNAFSNPTADQALGISLLVDPAWIEAEVYGEIPWMGLAKLALQTGQTNPAVDTWERVGNAFAPLELWSMFFCTLALLILVPLSIDTYRAWRRLKSDQEATRRLEDENRRIMEARRLARKQAEKTRVVSFAEVVSVRPLRPGSGPPGR